MTRLLTTTAVLMSLSGAAFAESHSAKPTADTDTMTQGTTMSDSTEIGSVMSNPTDFLASNLIGMRIYNVKAELDTSLLKPDGVEVEWDDIGEVNDIIVTADGKVSAVILGVGGFLGIGERDVAIAMGAITVVTEEGDSGDRFLVVKTSKEQLEQVQEFDRSNG